MTILHSALLVLLATSVVACNKSTESKAAADTVDAQRALSANQSSPAPVPATAGTVGADGQPVNALGAAVLEFHKHLETYMKTHRAAEGKVPNLKRTDDPTEISSREKALGEMIMTLRAGAQESEIFAKEVQPYLRKIIVDDFAKRSLADRRALVHELTELPKGAATKVSVNTVYSTSLPLLTFPAALLQKLPDLPPELEYRIVGRHLILRDVKANLIVDVLRDAIPSST